MEQKIINSLNHLKELNDNPFTLQKVAYWLYEYNDLYKEIKNYPDPICEICQEWYEQDLPLDCLQNPDYCTRKDFQIKHSFTAYYEAIEYGVEIQELDEVCKTALEEYKNCNDTPQLKDWVIKYLDMGYDKLFCFSVEHLKEEELLHPWFFKGFCFFKSPIIDFDIYIHRKYYENIIEFEDVFNKLFYEKEVYPEKLKEIEEEMQKIPKSIMPKIE